MDKLIAKAREAARFGKVGAAVLTESGKIFSGFKVTPICGERMAIYAAIIGEYGLLRIKKLYVVGGRILCAACIRTLRNFADTDLKIIIEGDREYTLEELKERLEDRNGLGKSKILRELLIERGASKSMIRLFDECMEALK